MRKAIFVLVIGGVLVCAAKPVNAPRDHDRAAANHAAMTAQALEVRAPRRERSLNLDVPDSRGSGIVSAVTSPDRSTTNYRIEEPGLIPLGGTFSIAPDGKHYASYDMHDGIAFGAVGSITALKVGAPSRLGKFQYVDVTEFAWSANSQAIFSGQRAVRNPGGWPTGAISPVLITLDGKVRRLPPLTHPAGDLDGIAWVGHQGLALAEFGTKGNDYQPARPDPNPTIAIVDALRGRVLQSAALPIDKHAKIPERISAMDTRFDKDGHIYALFRLPRSRWLEWRQGSPLRAIPAVDAANSTRFAVTPDLKRVLIAYELIARGAICENYSMPPCPPMVPVQGKIAELRDLATGKPIWTINGTSRSFSRPLKPAISDDGSIAVMTMPDAGRGTDHIVLVSMRDGHVIQSLENPPSTATEIGFREAGKVAWIRGYGSMKTFRLRP